MKNILSACMMLSLLCGCGAEPASGGAAPGKTRKLVILAPHNEDVRNEFAAAFVRWHEARHSEKVEVEWNDAGGASDAERYVISQFKGGAPSAGIDVFWGGGCEPYMRMADLGLLQPYKLPDEVLALIPVRAAGFPVYDAEYRWYGTALSGFGIIFNKGRLAKLGLPEPKTWEDLADPRYLNELSAADPRHSGSALTTYEIILQAYGWERGMRFLTEFSGNVRTYTGGANQVPADVSLGEATAGLVIDFYAWSQIAADGPDKLGFTLPQGATAITPDAIAILKGAPDLELAQRFVSFVLSREGQALWILPKGTPGGPVSANLGRIPVMPCAQEHYADISLVKMNPSEIQSSFTYDPIKASERRNALRDLFGALLIDQRQELARAWAAVCRAGGKAEDIAALCAAPVSEEELTELSQRHWDNAVTRNETIAAWQNFALEKYSSLLPGR